MTYEEKCAALGIKRPDSLAKKFPDDMPSVAIGKERMRPSVGPRVNRQEDPEDLTHLNPPHGSDNQAKTKAWWNRMSPEEKSKFNTHEKRKNNGHHHWWAVKHR